MQNKIDTRNQHTTWGDQVVDQLSSAVHRAQRPFFSLPHQQLEHTSSIYELRTTHGLPHYKLLSYRWIYRRVTPLRYMFVKNITHNIHMVFWHHHPYTLLTTPLIYRFQLVIAIDQVNRRVNFLIILIMSRIVQIGTIHGPGVRPLFI